MRKDIYTIRAKSSGLRARSAFKLFQINDKYHIIKNGNSVLDLGCWPGGWLIAAKKLNGSSRVAGIDFNDIEPISGVEFYRGDAVEIINKIDGKFDVIISDMAPKTTGIINIDIGRSLELAGLALGIAREKLNSNGNFLVKVFQGSGFNEFVAVLRKNFALVKISKPEASKKRSKELYIVAIGFKSA